MIFTGQSQEVPIALDRFFRTVAILFAFSVPCVYAEEIVFEFSGTFGECYSYCALDSGLLALEDTSFSGTLSIPSSAPSRTPDTQGPAFRDQFWSHYNFSNEEAYLTFDAEGTAFDLDHAAPISSIVSFCDDASCFLKDNFIWFNFDGPDYLYQLVFSAKPERLPSTQIAAPDEYSLFFPSFGIGRHDTFSGIATETLLDVTVTAVPLPAGIVLFVAPLAWMIYFRSVKFTPPAVKSTSRSANRECLFKKTWIFSRTSMLYSNIINPDPNW